MKKWIPIDQFGSCSKKHCNKYEECFDSIGTKYKFYLAFENSLCEDYITEKFWNMLGMTIAYNIHSSKNLPKKINLKKLVFNLIEIVSRPEYCSCCLRLSL